MESFAELFQLVLQRCQEKVSETAYTLWLKDIIPLRLEGSTAFLKVNSDFKMGIVREKYTAILKSAFEEVLGFEVEIDLSCDTPAEPEAPDAPQPAPGQAPADYPLVMGDYAYTFDTFIVGPSNKFAHAASWAVAIWISQARFR